MKRLIKSLEVKYNNWKAKKEINLCVEELEMAQSLLLRKLNKVAFYQDKLRSLGVSNYSELILNTQFTNIQFRLVDRQGQTKQLTETEKLFKRKTSSSEGLEQSEKERPMDTYSFRDIQDSSGKELT